MSRKKKQQEKIIHVVFGPGGGRVAPERLGAPSEPPPSSAGSREPVTDVFTRSEIARLIGLSESRLRTLDKSGIVTPSARRKGRRAYDFQDLIALRAAKALLDNNIGLRQVTRAIANLRSNLPRLARPLHELRIVSDGRRVVVQTTEGHFEPETGQMVLDLEVKTLREDIVRVLRPSAGRERAKTAYDLYLRASELDEDPATMNEAVALYEKAIEYDPWLAIAHTNLGNIAFRRQDVDLARQHYQKALEIDGRQPEAKYNLGYLMLERGEPEKSVEYFLGALEADPHFADAYFNLAMAYEQLGETEKARPLWQNYISLEPQGTWTDIARRHL
ncbi:MAG TPA: tetratricopeptide repeat protein [Polyangiaceae bacterium]|nr:tetratricopeptide repeat protein [Polyangiaceae bacterium]